MTVACTTDDAPKHDEVSLWRILCMIQEITLYMLQQISVTDKVAIYIQVIIINNN